MPPRGSAPMQNWHASACKAQNGRGAGAAHRGPRPPPVVLDFSYADWTDGRSPLSSRYESRIQVVGSLECNQLTSIFALAMLVPLATPQGSFRPGPPDTLPSRTLGRRALRAPPLC